MKNRKFNVKRCFILANIVFISIMFIAYIIMSISFHSNIRSHIKDYQKFSSFLMVGVLEELIEKEKYIFLNRFSNKPLSKSMFLAPDIKNAYLLSKDGEVERVYKRENGFYIYPGINIRYSQFYEELTKMEEESRIFPISYSPFSNRLVRAFVMKRDKGDYLVIDINLLEQSKYISRINSFKKSIIAVSIFNDIIVSKTSMERFPFVLPNSKESKDSINLKKSEKFFMTPIYDKRLKEKLFVLIPYSVIYKEFSPFLTFSTVLFVSIVLLLVIGFILFTRHIILPLSALSNAISKFSLENPITLAMLPPTRYQELENLKVSFLNVSKKMSEDALRLKQQSIYLREMLEHFPNGIVVLNPDRKIIEEINKTMEELCDRKRKDIIGKPFYEVFPLLKGYLEEKDTTQRRVKIKKDEKILDVKINYIKIGTFSKIIIQIDDITEKEKLQEKLEQVKRMETVNLLSKGFSHDFNNLLNALSGYMELLNVTEDPEKKEEIMKKLRNTLEVAEDLVKKIQILSKATDINKELISVKEFLVSPISNIRSMDNYIDFELDIDEILDEKMYGDSYLLTVCMLNILKNAREAVRDRKDPKVKIYGKKREIDGKKYISITIEDNGKGMDPETKDRIFEPFFTSKKLGKIRGTGLGMTIVYGIIDAHGGSIEIESEEGKGTKVTILLPMNL